MEEEKETNEISSAEPTSETPVSEPPVPEEPTPEEPTPEEPVSEEPSPEAPIAPEYNEPADSEPEPVLEPSPEPAPEPEPTPAPEISSAEPTSETPVSEPPVVPTQISEPLSTEPKKKSRKPLVITLIILLVLALSACAVLLFMPEFVTNLLGKTAPKNSQETVEPTQDQQYQPTEANTEETEIANESIKTALFNRLYDLHHSLSSQKDFSSQYSGNRAEAFKVNERFEFRGAYEVSENLYPDSSALAESDKLYIVTSLLKRDDKTEEISELGAPDNFYNEIGACDDLSEQDKKYCEIAGHPGLSEETVEKEYKKLFGETPSHQNPTAICGRLNYSQKYHLYYPDVFNGCGGVDTLNHQLYISKYTEQGNKFYIYIALNSTSETYSPDGEYVIFNKYLKHADLYDSELNKDKEVDEKYIYKTVSYDSYEVGSFLITADNYKDFDQFRFVFEKDSEENYVFKTVEKL